MKTKRLNKKMLLDNPTQIEPMSVKKGLFRSDTIDLKVIESNMRDNFKQMAEFGANLVPGKQEKFFLGVGIVVLQTQKDQSTIVKNKTRSMIGAFINSICGCCSSG